MRNTLFVLIILAISAASASTPPPDKRRIRSEQKLNLTDAQQEQFQKISFDTKKKQIDLRAKLETAKLELRRLMVADDVDKSAIEKKLNDVASARTALKMNRINGWIEKNKVLTPEQQKIWRTHLRANRMPAKDRAREVRIERTHMSRRPMMQRNP